MKARNPHCSFCDELVVSVVSVGGERLTVEELDVIERAIRALGSAEPAAGESKGSKCENPDCEDGHVQIDTCAACEGPIYKTCPDCRGTGLASPAAEKTRDK